MWKCACLVLGTLLVHARAFPNRVPISTMSPLCDTMMPSHGRARPSSQPCPFRIDTSTTCVEPGQAITVTLSRSKDWATFTGLFVQARPVSGVSVSLGRFSTSVRDFFLKSLRCFDKQNSAVGHNAWYQNVRTSFLWTPADDIDAGSVVFRATFVSSFEVFWVGVESDVVRQAENCSIPATTTTTEVATPSGNKYTTASAFTNTSQMFDPEGKNRTQTPFQGNLKQQTNSVAHVLCGHTGMIAILGLTVTSVLILTASC